MRASTSIYSASKTSAYVALVNAIEALAPSRQEIGECDKCAQKIWEPGPGPTANFKNFVERYANDSWITNKMRDKMYSVRSKAVHSGFLFKDDYPNLLFHHTKRGFDEWEIFGVLRDVVRTSLYNWLQSQA